MHSFEVHSNESTCRKNVRLGLEQVRCDMLVQWADLNVHHINIAQCDK